MICSTTIPDSEPTRITQGERVQWTRDFCAFPATLWTLEYRFRGPSTGFNITGTADDLQHEMEIPAATTAAMSTDNGGKWKWDAYATDLSDEDNVEHICSGYVQVYPGAAGDDLDAIDNRSQAEKNLAMLDAALSADAGMVVEYEISTPAGSRRVKKSRKDAMEERKYWASIVAREKGGGAFGVMRVRMPGY